MQVRVDWVLPISGTQAIKKKWPVRSVIPDYLSVSYDYALIKNLSNFNKQSCVTGSDVDFIRVKSLLKCYQRYSKRNNFTLKP